MKILHQKGGIHTIIVVILIISVALFVPANKTLFVHESGNISIFGEGGILLAIGLLWRWKYVREFFAVFSFLGGILFLLTASHDYLATKYYFSINNGLLGIILMGIFVFLGSNPVREFQKQPNF